MPRASVIFGGMSPAVDRADGTWIAPLTFLKRAYQAGAKGNFAGLGMHPYTFPQAPTTPNTPFAGLLPKLHAMMEDHGEGHKKIWGKPALGPFTTLMARPLPG